MMHIKQHLKLHLLFTVQYLKLLSGGLLGFVNKTNVPLCLCILTLGIWKINWKVEVFLLLS